MYSYTTSLPAYKENQVTNKKTQCEDVLSFVIYGANNLLQISQLSGIPQAIVSARVNDLVNEGKVEYNGHVIYSNRLRKKIILFRKINVTQNTLF